MCMLMTFKAIYKQFVCNETMHLRFEIAFHRIETTNKISEVHIPMSLQTGFNTRLESSVSKFHAGRSIG